MLVFTFVYDLGLWRHFHTDYLFPLISVILLTPSRQRLAGSVDATRWLKYMQRKIAGNVSLLLVVFFVLIVVTFCNLSG